MAFGENLKNLRTHKNITQQQLAEYLNVTRPTIAGYETKGKEPDYQTLVDIADYFQVPVDFLIREPRQSKQKSEATSIIQIPQDDADCIYNIVSQCCKLNSYDLILLQNYIQLLLNQPSYKRKKTSNNNTKKQCDT